MVELRGLEPLTPTLPGSSITPEQAGYGQNSAVVGVFGGVTVVRVVVKIVVSTVVELTHALPAWAGPSRGQTLVRGCIAA